MQANVYTRERKHIGSIWSRVACLALPMVASSLSVWLDQNRAPRGAMARAWVSSSSSYGAQNSMKFDPTWSRRQGGLVLQTCCSGDGPREASDGEAAQAAFNGGEDDVWRCSSSKDFSGGGGVGGGSSSKWRIGTGGSGVAARRRRCGSAMVARVWAKFTQDMALFIGLLAPNQRGQKS
jgi:hypothetical protein